MGKRGSYIVLKKMKTTELTLEESLRGRESTADNKRKSIALSRKIHAMVQPLLDWYQFASREALAWYLADELTLEEIPITHSITSRLVLGGLRYDYGGDLRRIYLHMRRLLDAAQEGRRENLSRFAAPIEKYDFKFGDKIKNRIYILNNQEALDNLIDKTVKDLLGEQLHEAKTLVQSLLDSQTKVKNPSSLVERVRKEYRFASTEKTYEFLADFAEIPMNYQLGPFTSKHKIPSNSHRKTFAMAAVLDYAAKHGFKEHAESVIIEHGIRRSLKEQTRVTYLVATRAEYMQLIKQMEKKGIKGHALGGILSGILGITVEDAEYDYIAGRNQVIDRAYYYRLKQFIDLALPNISVIDITNETKRQSALDKFKRENRDGARRVLVVYSGPASTEVDRITENIREFVQLRLGFLFLYDRYGVVNAPDFFGYRQLLALSQYKT